MKNFKITIISFLILVACTNACFAVDYNELKFMTANVYNVDHHLVKIKDAKQKFELIMYSAEIVGRPVHCQILYKGEMPQCADMGMPIYADEQSFYEGKPNW